MKLEFEDGMISNIIMNSIAKAAKDFDASIDANQWGNLPATPDTITEWQIMSDKLWAVVRQFSK